MLYKYIVMLQFKHVVLKSMNFSEYLNHFISFTFMLNKFHVFTVVYHNSYKIHDPILFNSLYYTEVISCTCKLYINFTQMFLTNSSFIKTNDFVSFFYKVHKSL